MQKSKGGTGVVTPVNVEQLMIVSSNQNSQEVFKVTDPQSTNEVGNNGDFKRTHHLDRFNINFCIQQLKDKNMSDLEVVR